MDSSGYKIKKLQFWLNTWKSRTPVIFGYELSNHTQFESEDKLQSYQMEYKNKYPGNSNFDLFPGGLKDQLFFLKHS